jgi:type IV pilus assembly protein PilF
MKTKPLALALAGTAALILAAPAGAENPPTPVSLDQAAKVNSQLAIEYLRQGNLEAARDKIEKALDQDPHTADTQMAAGLIYERLGDEHKAKSHYEQAVRLGKGDPNILNNVAVFYCRKGERKRGEEYFLKAAASPLYRTPEVAYTNAGRCARDDGRPREAEQYFRRALGYRPDTPDALLEMADLTHTSGNDLQARAFLQRYFSVASASPGPLLLGVHIERTLGDAAQAEAYARRLKSDFPMSEETARLLQEEKARP